MRAVVLHPEGKGVQRGEVPGSRGSGLTNYQRQGPRLLVSMQSKCTTVILAVIQCKILATVMLPFTDTSLKFDQ